jgi:hypothetical protein
VLAYQIAPKGSELEHAFRAYDGAISRGHHTLAVTLVYEGRNAGPFTYLGAYRYRVQSSVEFTAEESPQPAALEVVAHERTGAMVPVEQKPTMEIKAALNSSVADTLRVPRAASQ